MSTEPYELSPGQYLGIDPTTGDLAAIPARICNNCAAYHHGECMSFRSVLEYIFNEKSSVLPGSLQVSVSPDDGCARWTIRGDSHDNNL
jgi:hypothetical protein